MKTLFCYKKSLKKRLQIMERMLYYELLKGLLLVGRQNLNEYKIVLALPQGRKKLFSICLGFFLLFKAKKEKGAVYG